MFISKTLDNKHYLPPPNDLIYGVRTLSRTLEVKADTLRKWEARYGGTIGTRIVGA